MCGLLRIYKLYELGNWGGAVEKLTNNDVVQYFGDIRKAFEDKPPLRKMSCSNSN